MAPRRYWRWKRGLTSYLSETTSNKPSISNRHSQEKGLKEERWNGIGTIEIARTTSGGWFSFHVRWWWRWCYVRSLGEGPCKQPSLQFHRNEQSTRRRISDLLIQTLTRKKDYRLEARDMELKNPLIIGKDPNCAWWGLGPRLGESTTWGVVLKGVMVRQCRSNYTIY